MAERLLDGGGVSGDMDRLQTARLAGGEGEGLAGKAEVLGQDVDNRSLALPFSGCAVTLT